MKKIFLLAILLIAAYVSGQNNSQKTFPTDGIYTGESRSIYTDENYWGVATITIVNERITQLNFKIVDKNNVETFDEKYEKHFAGNDRYIQQCRNDYKGILAYTKKFREKSAQRSRRHFGCNMVAQPLYRCHSNCVKQGETRRKKVIF